MKYLSAIDALCKNNVTRVLGEERPSPLQKLGHYYVVFSSEPSPGNDGGVLGIISAQQIASFPQRIFADLLTPHSMLSVAPTTSLDAICSLMEAEGVDVLPVIQDKQYVGIVSKTSILEALLKAEQKLLENTLRLNQIIAADHQQLIEAKELAEKANHAKSQFLSRMSHELRTPLNAILGFTQVMEGREDNVPLGEERGSIKTIATAGWHLLRIIDDLLNLAAIEADKVEIYIENIDMGQCIRDCLETMSPLMKERAINLNYSPAECQGTFVLADRFRLKQVLLNLLANAVKYNCRGGTVGIACLSMPSGRLRISVSDTGSGIPAEDLPTLFEPFSRLDKREYSIEGAGIGLSIAKHLTELMQGMIGVDSVMGQGSTFWMEFNKGSAPVHHQSTSLERADTSQSRSSKQLTLLYIEDSPSHLELMGRVIKEMGNIKLLMAHTPNLGLDLARAHRPDIILSDICLPGMDGYELLEHFKSDERTSHIPVVALSANAMPSQVEKGLRAGFRRYLTKPIDLAEFRKVLTELQEDEATCCDGNNLQMGE